MFWLSQTKGNPLLSAPEHTTPFATSPFVMSHQKVYCESHWKCPGVRWMKKARWAARRMCKPNALQTLGGLQVTPLPRQPWEDNYLRTQLPVWEYLSLENWISGFHCLDPFHMTKCLQFWRLIIFSLKRTKGDFIVPHFSHLLWFRQESSSLFP